MLAVSANDEPRLVDVRPFAGPVCGHILSPDGEVSIDARMIDPPVLGSVADVPAHSHRLVQTEELLQRLRGDCTCVPKPIAQLIAVLKVGIEEIVFLLGLSVRLCSTNALNEAVPSLHTLILASPASALVHTQTQTHRVALPQKE